MNSAPDSVGPKLHPASREILPDDPLQLQGCEAPGDQELMLRILVEEFARLGWRAESIMRLACDPNYLAFHGLYLRFGEDELRRRVASILARCGVMRFREQEITTMSEQLVQLNLPT